MINYVFALLLSVSLLQAQKIPDPVQTDVKVGDVLEIGKPESKTYRHIDFPRANFIIKRGGIANYEAVEGEKVVVTSIQEKKNGTTQIKLKRTDGGRFFGSHKVVSADIKEALASGELQAR